MFISFASGVLGSLELYRDSVDARCQDFSVSIDNRDMHDDIT